MKLPRLTLAGLVVVSGLACDSTKPGSVELLTKRPGVAEASSPPDPSIAVGQTLYVPLYSHVYTADSAHPLNVAATIFVRNTDRSRPIIVTRVEYFDSGGKSIRSYLKTPLKVGPMASIDFFVKESDETGGASPSFLIDWVAVEPVTDPVVESVMIGTTGSQGISFVCPARIIDFRSNQVIPSQPLRQ